MTVIPPRAERDAPQTPLLVVIRGNSGSGKTTTAREVRRRAGRGTALLEQDYLRRVLLREHGGNRMQPVAPAFIASTARAALDAGYHVILEGILDGHGHGTILRRLIAEHPGRSAVFYFDVSFDETVRRHLSRAEPIPVTGDQMRQWYVPCDLLGIDGEHVFAESAGFDEAVTTILRISGLADATALTPCPTRCPRCAEKRSASANRGSADRHCPP
ncbi:AAA family ATPase [Micromonospora tarensis]|uniref:Kinase n=1 Tax=Micromonospora tarensis TaxID=2806100 RepID=A0ABS1YHV0_9ACTN|nr:AAA family ATPase [Micromonospora tarensis]MBM0277009.1 kinase [Micromonospora tarensis]